jgi:hypothetical protein
MMFVHRGTSRIAGVLAVTALLFCAPLGHAAERSRGADFRECFKSLRSCQKSRCGKLDGPEQVSCVQQCGREYDSCAGAAQGGNSAAKFPSKDATPAQAGKARPHNLQRKPQAVQQ